jgi:hypothetical protein
VRETRGSDIGKNRRRPLRTGSTCKCNVSYFWGKLTPCYKVTVLSFIWTVHFSWVTLGRPIFVIPKRYAVTEEPKISDTRHEEIVSDTLPPSLRIARCPSPRVRPAAVVRRSSDLLLLRRPPLLGKDSFSAPRPAASHPPSARPPPAISPSLLSSAI